MSASDACRDCRLRIELHAGATSTSTQKHPEGRIFRFLLVGVAERTQLLDKARPIRGGHLQAGKDPAIIGPMISIVEQSNVPIRADGIEEFQQRARSFWKLESQNDFVAQ